MDAINEDKMRAFDYAMSFYNPDTDNLEDVFENAYKIYNFLTEQDGVRNN